MDDHEHEHDHDHGARHHHRRMLDLDAEVFGDQLSAVLDLTGSPAARGVVDVGAGSGAGARLLRERFPEATVTCVDDDPQMLEVLSAQGFAVVEADLDEGFPELAGPGGSARAPVDLVWMASSLHHVAHPGQLLSGISRALAPGGVLIVVELAGLPSFVRDERGTSLEQRCHDVAAAEGWNHHPDWTPLIEAAGISVTRSELTTVAPVTPAAREYAQLWWARLQGLAGLTADDRAAVADLLERFHDVELEPRATRTVWVATSDQDREPS